MNSDWRDYYMRRGEYKKDEDEEEDDYLEWRLDFQMPPHVYSPQFVYYLMLEKKTDDCKNTFQRNVWNRMYN